MYSDITLFLGTNVLSAEAFVLACGCIVLIALYRRRYHVALYFALGPPVVYLAVTTLKNLFHVARPMGAAFVVHSYAFPSGHATGATFLAVALYVAFVRQRNFQVRTVYTVFASFFVLLVSYSRLYFGVHTYVQVLAGCVLGALLASLLAYTVFPTRRAKETYGA